MDMCGRSITRVRIGVHVAVVMMMVGHTLGMDPRMGQHVRLLLDAPWQQRQHQLLQQQSQKQQDRQDTAHGGRFYPDGCCAERSSPSVPRPMPRSRYSSRRSRPAQIDGAAPKAAATVPGGTARTWRTKSCPISGS